MGKFGLLENMTYIVFQMEHFLSFSEPSFQLQMSLTLQLRGNSNHPHEPLPTHHSLLAGSHQVLSFPRVSISVKSIWKRERRSLLAAWT
jgi:hypothetical protein